jgi:hypothetical protein
MYPDVEMYVVANKNRMQKQSSAYFQETIRGAIAIESKLTK